MLRIVVASAVLAVTGIGAARSADVPASLRLEDAAALVTLCTVPASDPLHDLAEGFCLGYMTGAMQLYRAATASPTIENAVCAEGEVSRARMRAIFLDWADAHPEHLDEPAIDALFRAAVAAFPCTEGTSP